MYNNSAIAIYQTFFIVIEDYFVDNPIYLSRGLSRSFICAYIHVYIIS